VSSKRISSSLICAVLTALLFAWCMPKGVVASHRTYTPKSRLSANTARTLRIALPDTPLTVDPALVSNEENVQVAELLYSGLVRLNANYQIVAGAAKSWQRSADNKTYTFHLRNGLRFSNGDYVTASDFAWSLNRSLDPRLKSASAPTYLLDIKGANAVLSGKSKSVDGIRALDAHTLRITARWPVPYLLMELAYPTSSVLDKKRLQKLGPIDSSAWYASPIASGPYKLKSWLPNVKMVLVPNKYYLGVKPFYQQIVISVSPLPDTGLYPFITKSLDIVNLPDDDGNLAKQPGVSQTKMLAIDGLYMGVGIKPFSNTDVRRALTLSLNRPALIAQALGKSVTPFDGYVPPGQPGFARGLQALRFDPKRAKLDLRRSGIARKQFKSVTLYYLDDPAIARLAKAIVKSWRHNLGVAINVQALTSNTLLFKVQSNSLPLYLLGWSADYPDPHDWLSLQWESDALNNNVHYHNPAFDKVARSADVTWNFGARMRLYAQAQQILINDAAWIPLYIPNRRAYIRPGVSNLVLTGYGIIPRNGDWASVTRSTGAANRRAH